MATKTAKPDLKIDHKDALFDDFFQAALATMGALESQYAVTRVVEQIFGMDGDRSENEQRAKASLRKNTSWHHLSALYDYAVLGIVDDSTEPMSIVIDGSDVLKLASSENYWPSDAWGAITAMADGRFALDDGQPLTIAKIALLAKVDQRTVRNAISAGQLNASKINDPLEGEQLYVENGSARQWLHGRKGFKPTVLSGDDQLQALSSVRGPAEFGAYLVSQRKNIGFDTEGGKLVMLHNSISPQSIAELEAGVFSLPLSTVFPIADFYQVSRKELLDAVMRIFFFDEMVMLSSSEGNRIGERS